MNNVGSMQWVDGRESQSGCTEACGQAYSNITLAHYNDRKRHFTCGP